MCGRFAQTGSIKKLAKKRGVPEERILELAPRYNLAPSQETAVLVKEIEKTPEVALFKWGLFPSWAKDPGIGQRMINARAETLNDKPSFRGLLRKHRCIIPADGFYEWKKEGQSKTPYFIRRKSGEPCAFAGLWCAWKNPQGGELKTFTIITTRANDLMLPLHDRMPVILPDDVQDAWLDPANDLSQKLPTLLCPYSSGKLETFAVSKLVNSPANDLPECMQPVKTS